MGVSDLITAGNFASRGGSSAEFNLASTGSRRIALLGNADNFAAQNANLAFQGGASPVSFEAGLGALNSADTNLSVGQALAGIKLNALSTMEDSMGKMSKDSIKSSFSISA